MAQNFYELELNGCDSLKNWNYLYNTEAISINYTGQIQGTACINFNFDLDGGASTGVAGLYTETIGTKDISFYDEIRFNLYLLSANITNVQSGYAKVGTDATNYAFWNLTTAQMTAVANSTANQNWREIVLSSPSSASTSGTVDFSNINHLYFTFNYSGAPDASISAQDLRIDHWRAVKYFDNKYDVELDGQGYQLFQQEGSYNRSNQPYSVDRYSTGDITYSNFDTYQYKAQTDWSGGWNDEFGISENTFWTGYRLDNSEVGKIKTGFQPVFVTGVVNSGIVTGLQEYKQSAFLAITGGSNSSHIFSWPGTGNTLTLQYSVARSAIQDMIVFQNNLWVSVGEPYTTPNQMAMFDGTTWSAVNQSAGFMAELGDSLYTLDQSSRMRSFDGSTWTTEFTHTGWYGHRMVTWREKIWYLASTGDPRFTKQERCALYSYDGVDRLLIQEFDGWCKNSIAVYNNKLYFVVNGILLSYDGENIIEELDITSRFNKDTALDIYSLVSDLGIGIQSIGNTLYLVHNNNSALPYSTILMNAGNGFSPNFYGSTKTGGSGHCITALGTYTKNNEKRLLMGNTSGDLMYAALTGESGLNDNSFYGALLESSWIDANLFGIDKIFKSLQVFYENAAEQNTYFYYKLDDDNNNWILLGNITNYDNTDTFIEFNFPSATYGKKIKYQIRFNTASDEPDNVSTSDYNFVITDISLKYLLAPDTKRKWNLRVMLPNNMLLNSGIRDVSNGETLANTLWSSRIKKEVLQYKDIDNQIYNVIVNDVQIQGPYNVQTGRDSMGTNPEYVASIELLEG